jgi:hypothetical protein
MRPARPFLLASLLVSPLVGRTLAQCPPGAPMPQDLSTQTATPAEGGAAEVRWRLGRDAVAAGKADEAQQHLLAALELHPSSPAILLDLMRAAAADPDRLALDAKASPAKLFGKPQRAIPIPQRTPAFAGPLPPGKAKHQD